MLRSGQLRHRVEIQSRAAGTGTRGESTGAWSKVAERWAEITSLSGDELERARQRVPEARVQIRIRYYAGLSPQNRIVFGSRTFQVGYVDDLDQLHVEQILLCSELT